MCDIRSVNAVEYDERRRREAECDALDDVRIEQLRLENAWLRMRLDVMRRRFAREENEEAVRVLSGAARH